jgi:hypothetical protein
MTPTYDEAILCPRCGQPGNARVEESRVSTVERQVTVFCTDKSCPYYGHRWYLILDTQNTVIFHTHTPWPGLKDTHDYDPDA